MLWCIVQKWIHLHLLLSNRNSHIKNINKVHISSEVKKNLAKMGRLWKYKKFNEDSANNGNDHAATDTNSASQKVCCIGVRALIFVLNALFSSVFIVKPPQYVSFVPSENLSTSPRNVHFIFSNYFCINFALFRPSLFPNKHEHEWMREWKFVLLPSTYSQ